MVQVQKKVLSAPVLWYGTIKWTMENWNGMYLNINYKLIFWDKREKKINVDTITWKSC